MIGMGVGQYHLRHQARIDASGQQIGAELAGALLEVIAGAVVDHDQITAGADDGDIGMKRRAFGRAAEAAHDVRPLFRRRIRQHDAHRQHDEAVADDGNIEAAVPKAMDVSGVGTFRQEDGSSNRAGTGKEFTTIETGCVGGNAGRGHGFSPWLKRLRKGAGAPLGRHRRASIRPWQRRAGRR
ncbi:hypothetical protein D9M70_444750 [compost metagenome]